MFCNITYSLWNIYTIQVKKLKVTVGRPVAKSSPGFPPSLGSRLRSRRSRFSSGPVCVCVCLCFHCTQSSLRVRAWGGGSTSSSPSWASPAPGGRDRGRGGITAQHRFGYIFHVVSTFLGPGDVPSFLKSLVVQWKEVWCVYLYIYIYTHYFWNRRIFCL